MNTTRDEVQGYTLIHVVRNGVELVASHKHKHDSIQQMVGSRHSALKQQARLHSPLALKEQTASSVALPFTRDSTYHTLLPSPQPEPLTQR